MLVYQRVQPETPEIGAKKSLAFLGRPWSSPSRPGPAPRLLRLQTPECATQSPWRRWWLKAFAVRQQEYTIPTISGWWC